MNERIKELIVQSGNGQFHNDKCYPHIGSRTLEDWTKFAELMVVEFTETVKQTANELADAGFQQGQSEEEVMKSVNSALAVLDGIVAKFGVES